MKAYYYEMICGVNLKDLSNFMHIIRVSVWLVWLSEFYLNYIYVIPTFIN